PVLNYLLVTGESLKPGLVKRWFEKFPGIKIVNAYGPTEASDDITHFHIDGNGDFGTDQNSIPIGRTLRNLCIYIVDAALDLCPVGIKGEICVSGIGVGRGYLNNSELTAESFKTLAHELHELTPRVYFTGDIGRYLPDGNIEFFGRKDYQVKVRGFRIELEEIENKLSVMPGIHNAVVIDREDRAGNTCLCAYITLAASSGQIKGQAEVKAEIKSELSKTLPEYMVPAFIIILDTMPLTPNGKVDRKALPEPGESGEDNYIPPRDNTEKKLVEIWCQVMGVERIGIHDNFFSLGGNSLLGIRIVNKIQEWLQETVHVTILFLAPTIAQLAAKLASYKIEKETRIGDTEIAEIRSLIEPLAPLPAHVTSTVKTPPVMFILCPSRSGSTLLRVILAGHPKLFAPQEFELLSYNTLPERKEALSGKFGLYLEGVIRAIMELKHIDADEAKAIMEDLETQGLTVQGFYAVLQSWLGDRILVEKTPQYTYDMNILRRAEKYFDSPLYIHLVRNPYAVIHSYENARLDQLFKYDHRFSSRELGELLWIICHQNILEFLETVPAERKFRLKYEELVGNPAIVMNQMCRHFGLEFYPHMLDVYDDSGNRMTDGIYAESKMLGDVKFFTHSSIDTGSVEKWKEKYKTPFLGETAVQLAKLFGYTWKQARYSKIEPVAVKEHYELSPSQKRLWILDRLDDRHISYNIPGAYLVTGDLNISALEKSYETAVRRHEILRTTFITVEGAPRQKIHDFDSLGFKWEHIDLIERQDRREKAKSIAQEEAVSPFNLERGPLLRIKTVRLEQNQYLFLFTTHHIISDGWSMNVLIKEILALYGSYKNNCEKRESTLPPPQFQYRDYSEWLNSDAIRHILENQEKYWLEQLSEEIPVLNLPLDYSRPAIMSFVGSVAGCEIDKVETEALTKLIRSEGTSAFIIMAAIFTIFLAKLSGQEDIIIGTPIAGRHQPGLENILGMFVNTLALRSCPRAEMRFNEFLNQFRTTVWGAFENQDYPFETLVEKVVTKRDMGHNPLFDVMFRMQDNYEARDYRLLLEQEIDLEIKSFGAEHVSSKFDLTLIAAEQEGSFFFSCEYCTKLFREETIQGFFRYFKNAAAAISRDPLQRISEIEIISPEEKDQILYSFNNTASEYPRDKTIYQLFAEQASRTPDRVAVLGHGQTRTNTNNTVGADPRVCPSRNVRNVSLTYRQLNEQSDQLAGLLIEKGVVPDSIVGIMTERSIEMITGIFGILKSGGAYLPIDPKYPDERINYILADSKTKLLVTINGQKDEKVKNWEGEKVQFISHHSNYLFSHHSLHDIQCIQHSKLAYVIYTSGTTGKPKGSLIEHHSLVNRLNWMQKAYLLDAQDTILQKTSFTFDVSVWEIFWWSMVGARLCQLSSDGEKDPGLIAQAIEKNHITTMHFVPSMLSVFLDYLKEGSQAKKLSTLKRVIASGEALLPAHVERFKKLLTKENDVVLANLYGPTEATIDVSYFNCLQKYEREVIPIGKPIDNINLYILDKNFHHQPVGVIGELYIFGAGLARGYLNNPELTSIKFLSVPSVAKIYKTGDLARWLPDGNIEFLGRIDQQIKIRGFRIELGEIENLLIKHNQVKDATVVIKVDETGDKNLAAYFVSDIELPDTELREYLRKNLPDYMIPGYFVQLEKIPLSPNGKIDRKTLPKPGLTSSDGYTAPRNAIEKKLVEIWSDILGSDGSLGIDDNFFQVGGHSLRAIIMMSRIHKELDVKVELMDIFRTPTIRDIANLIQGLKKEIFQSLEPIEKKEYYPLSSAQKRLYFLQQMDKEGITYNIPTVMLLEGIVDKNKLENFIRGLIRRHESLRTSVDVIKEEPVQRIHEHVEFKIENYDFATEEEKRVNVKNFVSYFDLTRAPLLRVALAKLEEEKHLLMIDMHHIISDGTSMNILVKDLMILYQEEDLPKLHIQYKDFSEWQKSEKQKEAIKQQEHFWLKEFAGEIPVLELPTDYLRPAVQNFEGSNIRFELDKNTTGVLKKLVVETGVTLYMLLLSIYTVFLSKLTNQEDIVIGSPTAGRRHADLENIIGMFVNTLALRIYPSGKNIFTGFLLEVKERTLSALENQDYPYEELVESVMISRDVSRNPLFDTMLVLQNTESQEIKIPGLKLVPYEFENKKSKFDLSLTSVEVEEKLLFIFQYSTKLFKEETINRFILYFKNIVNCVILDKDRRISDFEIITEKEKRRILFDFNDTEAGYPKDKTIEQLFAEQAMRTPDHAAVLCHGQTLSRSKTDHNNMITYRRLNELSNRLAVLLIEKGVLPGTIIGIMMGRSMEMIIGIMGILKSGGAYLPIDPDYPQERIDFMLKDSGAGLLVTANDKEDEKVIRKEDEKNIEIVFLDSFYSFSFPTSYLPNILTSHPFNLAYVIYTSGSTGKPKGVMIEHAAVQNFIEGMMKCIDFKPGKRILALTTISFDIFGLEVLLPLCKGLEIVMADEEQQRDIRLLKQLILNSGVDMLQATPTRMQMLVESEAENSSLGNLKEIMVGGETFPIKLKSDLAQLTTANIYNMYGPSETTIWSTIKKLSGKENITIGKPIINTQIYILNKYLKIQPVGIPGEMYIGGDGVAKGYLNRPELTAEKFDRDLWIDKIFAGVFYCTGDLARWLEDGNIEFLGRIDQQVKLRGFRIELGEIENLLLKHDRVKDAVVSLREDNSGDKYLCAYIVSDKEYKISELREFLAKELPDYMMPAHFIPMEQLPLTPGGKTDRRALPLPEIGLNTGAFIAPRNWVEIKLQEIWQAVLKSPGVIGITDDFFQLGGHSLRATALASRIQKELNVSVPLTEIFKRPTIKRLAEYIDITKKEIYTSIEPVEKKQYHALSPAQKRLYLLDKIEDESINYNIPQVIPFPGPIDIEKIEKVFKNLICRHESLRTSFVVVEEEPVQRIHDAVTFEVEVFAELFSKSDPPEAIVKSFIRPFDLAKAPLLRVGIIKKINGEHILLVDMHHIITDGISNTILRKEFLTLYSGKDEKLSVLRLQYKDYAHWQNSEIQRNLIKEQEAYWLAIFSENVPVLNLPTDYPRPDNQSFEGSRVSFLLDIKESDRLKILTREMDVTLYMSVLSIFSILLSRLSGQEEIVIGTPVAGRRHLELEKIIGMFVNTLALRNHVPTQVSYKEFIKELKSNTLKAYENQEYQFEMLVEKINVVRDIARNPVFDVMFNLLNIEDESDNVTFIELENADKNHNSRCKECHTHREGTSKFDLTLTAVEIAREIHLKFEYCTRLFRAATIDRFITYFKKIVEELSVNADQNLSEIEILTKGEREQILSEFNDTQAEYPKNKTIEQLFAEQVLQTGDHIAIVEGGNGEEEKVHLSYRELNNRSNHIANRLRSRHVKPGAIIGIMAEPSLEMVIGIMGIIKAGGVFLPIEPGSPVDRVNNILDDSNTGILLTQAHLPVALKTDIEIIHIEGSAVNSGECQDIISGIGPADPLYVIYTSGTTGRPKGVLITHKNIMNYVYWFVPTINLSRNDRAILTSSFAFDALYTQFFSSLLTGCELHVIPRETFLFAERLLNYLETNKITYIKATPSLFNLVVDNPGFSAGKLKGLRLIMLGGEAINVQDVEKAHKLCPHLQIMNHYGPTETTIGSIARFLDFTQFEAYKSAPTIGKPLHNTWVYILDKAFKVIPIGVAGGLYIGGEGVGLGYVNKPELTA
ncbi:MAG TPA: amino acid adenylation domain-containing protein, partial [Candidatus Kapabacteria bacterium]|nr:amino acid adenylation domain-containing protein [Candidatus Kapabacteria bacterium]